MRWDYNLISDGFNDGTSDTFDGFLRFTTQVNEYGDYGNSLSTAVGVHCDLDHINDTENPYAYVEYYHSINVQTTVLNVTRSFYAPINANWIRVIDTIGHSSEESQNLTVFYEGNLGSDIETVFEAQSAYYIASSDGGNGTNDTPFGMNFAGQGGGLPSNTRFFSDALSWRFNVNALGAGKRVSIMHILSQFRSAPEAVNGVKRIVQQPLEIFQNLDAAIIPQIFNWDLCGAVFDVVSETTCVTPAQITFRTNTVGLNLTLSTVGNVPVPQSGEISLELVGGTYEVSWERTAVCGTKSHSFTAKAPQENLAVTVQNSGNFQASATGGYGEYKYEWILNGDNLSAAFDNGATVVAIDAQGCRANATVDLPSLNQSGQIVSASSAVLPTVLTMSFAFVLSLLI